MKMPLSKFRLCSVAIALMLFTSLCPASAQDSEKTNIGYQHRIERIQRRWMNMIPSLGLLQYAGDIGVASLGIGWDYGCHDRWETIIFGGFVPKYDTERSALTFTLKEQFVPWSIDVNKYFSVQPLTAMMSLNTIFDEEYWVQEPDRYPEKYYGFSSKLRIGIGIGQRISVNIPESRRIYSERLSLYYELSTCDLYLISAIPNNHIHLSDILRLGIGIQYKFL